MTPEDKLIEILENCLQKDDTADREDVEIALTEAFNLGIQIAADNAKTATYVDGYSHKEVIDKQSILKWKITI